VVAVALLSAVVGYVYEKRQPPAYEAVTRIELRNPFDMTLFRNERGTPFTEIDRYLNSQADLVTSPQVMARASTLLQGSVRPALIRQHLTAESSTKIFEVTVRARWDDATEAANIVNAVTKAYEQVAEAQVKAQATVSIAELRKLEAELRARLDQLPPDEGTGPDTSRTNLSQQILAIQQRIGQIGTDAAVFGAGITRIDQARAPETAVSDSPRRRATIFGLLGFIAALVLAFWRGERVRVIDSREDAAGAVDAPLLGAVPSHPTDTAAAAAPVLGAPGSAAARDYEFIASAVSLAARDSERRSILVTSLEAGPAKSVTALNLALSAAQDDRSVILLDLEPAATLTTLLRAHGSRGASDLVALSAAGFGFALGDGSMTPIEGLASFCFIPTGTREANGRATAESAQVAKVLVQLQQEADLIFVDGPALWDSPGGVKVAAAVDGVILVLPRGTKLEQVHQTRALLATARAPIIGIVFDSSHSRSPWRQFQRWLSERRRPSQP